MSIAYLGSVLPLILLLLIAFAILQSSLRIVPQQQSWIVERLGRFHRALSPGLNVLVPFVDRIAYRFDLREVPSVVTPSTAPTSPSNTSASRTSAESRVASVTR